MKSMLLIIAVFLLTDYVFAEDVFELSGTFLTAYGPKEICPVGKWAIGFKTKVEKYQGGNDDDTAMNGIGLVCGNGYQSYCGRGRTVITSSEGPWGDWRIGRTFCRTGLTAARLKVEGRQGGGDDTGTNSIQFWCKSTKKALEAENPGRWGEWRSWGNCPEGKKIIGLQTMIEPRQYGTDDTALNSVKFFCG